MYVRMYVCMYVCMYVYVRTRHSARKESHIRNWATLRIFHQQIRIVSVFQFFASPRLFSSHFFVLQFFNTYVSTHISPLQICILCTHTVGMYSHNYNGSFSQIIP